MRSIFNKIVLLVCLQLFFACAGSKKFDFASAYKFSTHSYKKAPKIDNAEISQIINDDKLLVSQFNLPLTEPTNLPDQLVLRSAKTDIIEQESSGGSLSEQKLAYNAMPSRDRRDLRREVRADLKELKKELKATNGSLDTQQVQEVSNLMRWSIIIGSVGLVLLILGAIFSGALIYLGSIFVVGGLVLFILEIAK